ncbi:tetratricopeptide repeat protein [Isosphaeraceae bacterium EP7]
MSTEAAPAKKSRGVAGQVPAGLHQAQAVDWVSDAGLMGLFLILTCLLGAFPLKDTDFWWHLRTGDLIRGGAPIPRVDDYTYTVAGTPWIDLHWLFQLGLSWGYNYGGVTLLNVIKCGITALAVFLLVTSRRRGLPLWVTLLAWLPALYVLSGRMYIRPETLSLLFLSVYVAVLMRWDRRPKLAFALIPTQILWVNSQGLFILGPVLLVFALVDALLRPGSLDEAKLPWWKTIASVTVGVGLACLVNPYGLAGALYPLTLFFGTMSNPIFSRTIGELESIPSFIAKNGLTNSPPLIVHLATIVVGALSFLVPIFWLAWTRVRDRSLNKAMAKVNDLGPTAKKPKKAPRKGAEAVASWRLSPFRFLLYVAFSALSLQASRNTHQFAAMVGSLTAWNFAEWASAVTARRARLGLGTSATVPRIFVAGLLALAIGLVGSGVLHRWSGEGRTVALGEEPLWFPHEAVKFAGGDGMPGKFLAYHIGHPSLYEYYFAPEKKVFADARLEVMGAEHYGKYVELQSLITGNKPAWQGEMAAAGLPVVLVDHENNSQVGATLNGQGGYRCVWFDPIAAVYVHSSVSGKPAVDFAARHFRPSPETTPNGVEALRASARALRYHASAMLEQGRGGPARPLILLGLDYARRIVEADPSNVEGWKQLALLEVIRNPVPPSSRISRSRFRFDPLIDLGSARVIYLLNKTLERTGDEFTPLFTLAGTALGRNMNETGLDAAERLLKLTPINPTQRNSQQSLKPSLSQVRASMGPEPSLTWSNLGQLDGLVSDLLDRGRIAAAADVLERADRPEARPWDRADQAASLRLALGDPAGARALWLSAVGNTRPALLLARVGATYYVEGNLEGAKLAFAEALTNEPRLFDAAYGLALVEQDNGHAGPAVDAARLAVEVAPDDTARRAAYQIQELAGPFGSPLK